MPDQRSVLKEYRALEQKRLAQGLTPAEDRRHAELRALVGSDPSAAGPARGGFDVNAAAARLRESLLPAGLRNRPPPAPEIVTPEQLSQPEPEPVAEPAPLEAAYDTQPFPPVEAEPTDAFFDPSSLGDAAPAPEQAAWDAAAYDPNAQPYDPNAPAYDANGQPYDPNALAFDANGQPYDPNAPAYDANGQPYDPNAPQATWDPNAPWDPAAQQAYDPAQQPYDPAQQWDPNAVYDPNAAAAPDPGAVAYDPYAPADPGVPQPPWDPAAAVDPGAPAWDDGGFDPASLGGEPQPDAGPAPLELFEPGVEVPGEPAAFAPAPEPGGLPGDWADLAAPAGEPAPAEDPYAMIPAPGLDALDTEPAPPAPEVASPEEFPAGWDAAPPPADAPAGLELGEYDAAGPTAFPGVEALDGALPFDAAAASAIPAGELPEGFEPLPGEYDDGAGFGVAGYEAPPAPQLGDAAAPSEAPLWQPENALDQGFQLASGGSFDAAADAASPAWAGAAPEPVAPWDQHGELTEPEPEPDLGPPPELDRSGGHLTSDDPADDFFAISAPPLALGGPGAMAPAPQPAALAPPAPEPEPLPSIDDIPELEAEEILEAEEAGISEVTEVAEEIVHPPEAAAEAPPDLDFPTTIAEPFPPSPSPADFAAAATAAAEPPPPEAAPPETAPPAPEPAPLPAPVAAEAPALPAEDVSFEEEAPADAPSPIVSGAHRVVVHTLEGLVRRGVLQDADLAAPVLGLAPAAGAEPEVLGADKVKAIFFMLAPGEPAPAPEGKRVRVTFRDGRQVAGFSPDYREDGIGFFMIPADARTNTGRIWIYRAAVKQVLVS